MNCDHIAGSVLIKILGEELKVTPSTVWRTIGTGIMKFQFWGFKYNMNDLAAAIGRVQLKKLDIFNESKRKAICEI